MDKGSSYINLFQMTLELCVLKLSYKLSNIVKQYFSSILIVQDNIIILITCSFLQTLLKYCTVKICEHFCLVSLCFLFCIGVVKAMEAAVEFLDLGSLNGKTVAIQGAGKVGKYT